ncbi:MAG TPA: magnesium transporter CorA family protein [Actinomycetota bacterium]|jgi:magnesium transporter|nr:magnesium transporter CorA family protein [Actinomycetota bacterium]
MLKAMCHSAATGWTPVEDATRISDLRLESGNLLWVEVDVADLDDEGMKLIAGEFDFHPLAVEDALNVRQRPKAESYQSHWFLVFHQLDEVHGQLEARQIACFIGDRYVLTVHAGAGRTIQEATRRWESSKDLGRGHPNRGPGFLVYTLLDVVVDDYQTIADRLEDEIETLEEIVLEHPLARIQHQLYSLKQRLARMRRFALPADSLVEEIEHDEKHFRPQTVAELRDVRDHIQRIADQVRNIDDLAQAVIDLTRAEHSQALSEVTKKLTGWAAIIAVPTLITGFYGMNFALVPQEGTLLGFFFATGLLVVSAAVLYAVFKRKGWI